MMSNKALALIIGSIAVATVLIVLTIVIMAAVVINNPQAEDGYYERATNPTPTPTPAPDPCDRLLEEYAEVLNEIGLSVSWHPRSLNRNPYDETLWPRANSIFADARKLSNACRSKLVDYRRDFVESGGK